MSGTFLALFFASVSLGVSAFTDRKAFASAGMILLVIVTNSVAGVLHRGDTARDAATLFSISTTPLELVYRIYGQGGNYPGAPSWAVAAVGIGWILAGLTVLVLRYRTLEVTR